MSSFRRRSGALFLVVVVLLSTFMFWSATNMQSVTAQTTSTVGSASAVDLNYLASHLAEFKSFQVATRGIVKFYGSVYMYEDFWLQSQSQGSARIPIVLEFPALPVPHNGTLVEVSGTIEYSNLEGGFYYLNASSWTEIKNVILIGWDGVQRNHLFELLNRQLLPNLKSFINNGSIVNATLTDHRTDTKSGWTQILTGYRWWRTGVYNNAYWFHSIPAGYTIPERVESYFGKDNVATAFITGKMGHMEAQSGTSTTATGLYTHEAIYSNIPSQVDVCNVGDRNASVVGPLTLQFIENYSRSHFFAFFHFSDPDSAGHNQKSGGENSALYEDAIIQCDYWLGQILSRLAAKNVTQNTLLYVTADHGFDEGGYSHNNAPYVFLATNDKTLSRNGDQVDVAPTVYYGLGMWGNSFDPALDGFPLQINLPEGVEQKRQEVIADVKPPPSPLIQCRSLELNPNDVISISASDTHLAAVLLLIDNVLKSDGPWIWNRNGLVQAFGSYELSLANLSEGSHTIRVLAFDEHGSVNGPSITTINIYFTNIRVPPELPPSSSFSAPSPSPSPSPPSLPLPTPSPFSSPEPTPSALVGEAPSIGMYLIAAVFFVIALIAIALKAFKKKEK
jgi:hypothetical protein